MDKKQYDSWDDMLRSEGILCRGYGVVPKYAMTDRDLTLQAKSIYAFFCSLSGKGNTAFPAKETIKSVLGLGEESYYVHRKLLEDQGYITIEQTHGQGGSFTCNVYTLVENPKKFFETPPVTDYQTRIFSTICVKGIKSAGYGIIPYAVMSDPRMNVKEKGVYAYFASYTGSGMTAFPSVDRIVTELAVSLKSYRGYLKKLKDLGYVVTVQRKVNGTFSVNDYYLCSFDDSDRKFLENPPPWSKNPSTAKGQEPSQNPSAQNPRSKNPSTANPGTINNSSFTNNNIISNKLSQPSDDRPTEKTDREEAIARMREQIAYDEIPMLYPDADAALVDVLVSILAEPFWSGRKTYRIGKADLSSEEVRKRFLNLTMDQVVDVSRSIRQTETQIRNVRAYYMTALYNSLDAADAWRGREVPEKKTTPPRTADPPTLDRTRKMYERLKSESAQQEAPKDGSNS